MKYHTIIFCWIITGSFCSNRHLMELFYICKDDESKTSSFFKIAYIWLITEISTDYHQAMEINLLLNKLKFSNSNSWKSSMICNVLQLFANQLHTKIHFRPSHISRSNVTIHVFIIRSLLPWLLRLFQSLAKY